MATIRKVPRKTGHAYRVMIRRQGYPNLYKTFSKKKDAESFAKEYDRERALDAIDGTDEARRKTLGNLIDNYMEEYRGKDPTRASRLAWWKDHYGDRKLSAVNSVMLRDAVKELASGNAEHTRGKGKAPKVLDHKRSPATVNRYIGALSAVFKFAIEDLAWLNKNPLEGIKRKTEPRGRIRWLKDEEREALLAACDASSWAGLGLLVRLALATGARRGELLNLKWTDIDGSRIYLGGDATKNKEPRVLVLIPEVQRRLEEWGKVRKLGNPWVFPSTFKSRPKARYTNIQEKFREAVEAAGIEDFRFHDLRHTAASYLAQNNVPLLTIAAILGHKTLAMVQRYAHLSDKVQEDALNGTMTGKLG